MLPTFELFITLSQENPDNQYYRDLFDYAREHQLPLHFEDDNWADAFRKRGWPTSPESAHPYLIIDGTVTRKVSPFGTIEPWRQLGRHVAKVIKRFHDEYHWCPQVILSDNSELGEASVGEAVRDDRCPSFIRTASLQLKRRLVADRYRVRYAAMYDEIRRRLPLWGDRIKFGAYSGSLGEFGKSTATDNRYEKPWNSPTGRPDDMIRHDILWTNCGYLYLSHKHNTVTCPQILCENARFAWHCYEQETGVNRIRSIGFFDKVRPETVEAWRGMIRACLWIVKPEYVMQFDSADTEATSEELKWYNPVIEECRRLHDHPVLREHWRRGTLLENHWKDPRAGVTHPHDDFNGGQGHPFTVTYGDTNDGLWALPLDYRDTVTQRWHLLHVPINRRVVHWNEVGGKDNRIRDRWKSPRNRSTEIYVHALCSVKDDDGLLFAHSTGETYENVEVLVPKKGMVTIPTVPPEGKFWRLNSLTEIEVE